MQDLAYRRMRENDLPEIVKRVAVTYHARCGGNELRAWITDTMNTDNRVTAAVYNHLAKSGLAFVLCHKTAGEGHRQLAHLYRNRHLLRLTFRNAD